jgi:putative ABC transport system permease protein
MRYTLRSLSRSRTYALAAILTIALGVGANAAVFRVIYGVLIQPLPFRDPARLVRLWETHPVLPQLQATVPDFEDWRVRTHSFDQMAAHTLAASNNITMLGQGDPELVHATMASHDLFTTMGIRPLLGRPFSADEEGSQRPVGLISEALWRRKFGADPDIVNRQIQLETQSFTVIGVVPQTQAFPAWADFWMPLSFIEPELRNRRKYHPLEVVARLKPGVDLNQADADVQNVARQLAQEHPDTNGNIGVAMIPLIAEITGSVRPSLLLIWAAVGLVLLIACANVAHLFLARMLERRREMAIRESLGATPWHLIRQVLTESLLLAGVGGVAGAGLAAWMGELLRKLAQDQIPRMDESSFGGPVWLFTIAVALLCGLLFALPACVGPIVNRRRVANSPQFGAVLIPAEIALAFVVLTGAALLARSFTVLLNEDPGFRAENVLAMDVPLPTSIYSDGKADQFFNAQILPSVRALPGVEDVAITNSPPMSLLRSEHSRWATRFGIEGRTFPAGQFPVTQIRFVTPEYFSVLNIPLKRGRLLTKEDLGKPRYVVNETFARRFLANQDPTSKRLILGVMDPQQSTSEIIGVAGDTRDFGLDQEVEPTIYTNGSGPGTLLIKTAGNPAQWEPAIREAIRGLDPRVVVRHARPLERDVADSLAKRRFALTLLGLFGALAALLTAAGIYGLLAYSVNSRVREFGVRAAVGATPGDLTAMILREAALLTLPGLAAGVVASLLFARLMKSLVYGVSVADPWSIVTAGVFLALLVLVSAWLPARRAASVTLNTALRTD